MMSRDGDNGDGVGAVVGCRSCKWTHHQNDNDGVLAVPRQSGPGVVMNLNPTCQR